MKNLNILFVDDETHLLDGLRRMLFKKRDEWNMFFANSGEKALEIMSQNNIDIIITDMRMPGMNGAELLEKVMEKYPGTIRFILSGHSDEKMILNSIKIAHQFIAKPSNAERIIDAINRAIYLREFLIGSNILSIISKIEELPSVPSIFLKLEQELNSPNVSLSKIAELISEDMSIAAKILQIVNSAFFGLPRETADLVSAVNMLGINIIRSVIITLKFQNFVTDKEAKYLSVEKLWTHSQLVAKYAQHIYEKIGDNKYSSKEVYAAGLLHDVGKLILLKYPGYIENILMQNLLSVAEEEYKWLKVSHAEVGAYLLGIWNLPLNIVTTIAAHHRAEEFTEINLAASIYIANLFATDPNQVKLPEGILKYQDDVMEILDEIKLKN